jgi:U3 small nucleolar RNA-associated protein 22
MINAMAGETMQSNEAMASSEDEPITIENNKKRKGSDPLVKPIKKKSKTTHDLYKQPTVEELNQLRETENLFHSNLFRLQIEEVLSAVKLKNKYHKLLQTWFEKFKTHLNSIESSKAVEVSCKV